VDRDEDRAKARAETDEAYRAIGRYFVEFSTLTWSMRRSLGAWLEAPERPPFLIDTLLSDMMAMSVQRAFFGACLKLNQFDEQELKIVTRLRSRTKATIEDRNDLAHGDWMFSRGITVGSTLEPKLLQFRLTGSETAPLLRDASPAELDAKSDEVRALGRKLDILGNLCIPSKEAERAYSGKRVRDMFVMDSGGVSWTPKWSALGSFAEHE
jgi:hypothetical protein